MEKRTITFDPVPHTYTDEYGKQYTSVTTVLGKTEEEFDGEFWSMYRAVDQVAAYRPRPFPEARTIEISYQGRRIKMPLDLLYSGAIPMKKHPNAIKAEWQKDCDEACAWGNFRHDYLEDSINKFSGGSKALFHNVVHAHKNNVDFSFKVTNMEELENSPLKLMFPTVYEKIAYLIRRGWTAYAEKRIYSAKHLIAGTIDLLFVKGNWFYILDWKTNKKPMEFTAGYYKKVWNEDRTKKIPTKQWIKTGKKLKFPLSHLDACKGNLYTLQLSLYAYLCELWGLKCKGLVLCHIRPKLDSSGEVIYKEDGITRTEHKPEFHKIEYKKGEIRRLLDWHLGILKPVNRVRMGIQ